MNLALSIFAAVIATVFSVDLAMSARRRPRRHVAVWAGAMTLFAIATWALVVGVGVGWTVPVFSVFYGLGAIANIPLLALGSVFLVGRGRAPSRLAVATAGFIAFGLGVLVVDALTVDGIPAVAIPAGSEVFGFTVSAGGVTLPGPRVFAALAGSVGTVVLISLSTISGVSGWRRGARSLAYANGLIVAGTVAPALGGSLTAIGEAEGLALSLAVGATLLWAGFRLASSTPRTAS